MLAIEIRDDLVFIHNRLMAHRFVLETLLFYETITHGVSCGTSTRATKTRLIDYDQFVFVG